MAASWPSKIFISIAPGQFIEKMLIAMEEEK